MAYTTANNKIVVHFHHAKRIMHSLILCNIFTVRGQSQDVIVQHAFSHKNSKSLLSIGSLVYHSYTAWVLNDLVLMCKKNITNSEKMK